MVAASSSEDELASASVATSPRFGSRSRDSDYSAQDGAYSGPKWRPNRRGGKANGRSRGRFQPAETTSTNDGIDPNEQVTSRSRQVEIEVALPWVPLGKRETFHHVEVSDWENSPYVSMGTRYDRPLDPASNDSDKMGRERKRRRVYEDGDKDFSSNDSDDIEMDDSPPRRRLRQSHREVNPPTKAVLGRETRRSLRSRTHSQDIYSTEPDELSSRGRQSHFRQTRLAASKYAVRRQSRLRDEGEEDDEDELAAGQVESDGSGSNFAIVQSDILAPAKRRRKARARTHFRESSIEYETRRRSTRATKNTKTIDYTIFDEDEDDFGYQEEKAPAAPKVVGVREVFQRPTSAEFISLHRPVCEVCNGPEKALNKGILIHCQGCSNSYHKSCIGLRSTRDHCVTKASDDYFVFQCRFCIGNFGSAKKENRAFGAPRGPDGGSCQICHTKGPACAAFSIKKTPKQEEKLRAQNDGIDPVTTVAVGLLDNPKNVLFRCSSCRRGFHYEHLPHPIGSRDPAKDDPDNVRKHRLDEYSITWQCKECNDVDSLKAQTFVAWRPINKADFDASKMVLGDLSEDQIEYLVKWEAKSYRHCTWMPGAWAYGYTAAVMRAAFLKRNDSEFTDEADESGRNLLLKFSSEEAIPESNITPDVILNVHIAARSGADEAKYKQMSLAEKRESDLSRIHHVTKIYVKFEGLGYEDVVWDEPPSPDSETVWSSFYLAYQEYLNGKHFHTESARNVRERIQEFRTLSFEEEIKVNAQPAGLQRGKLMGYQLDGLNWLLWSYRLERSIILADEMGLGKTVQVVALLTSLVQDNPKAWPFLVVVPNSTCPNWRREIKKWAPDLRVVAYYGGKASQDLAYQYELFPGGGQHMKAHVVIMSYDSAQDDRTKTLFKSVKWAGLVVDEAQRLKNDENLLYKALRAMNIPWSLLLTGTPLQNNKRELFNLLQFVNPREMNAADLDAEFQELTQDRVQELHKKIRPYFLRRTKAQVLTFLPPMAQVILPVSMTVLQEKLCKSIMEKNPQLIRSIFARGKLRANEKTGLNNILMQLRKCLCHPFLYSKAIEDVNTSVEAMRRNLVEASSKLLLLETMLPILKERGHRVLIFSQFLEQLTILEDFLNGLFLKYERLDGSISSIEKQKRIDAFNAPDSELFCMLLSTRAGGVGINLATADTVIILDPDFNPHQDVQALSRAHRIGQKKKVLCFQLMTQDSPEEKILQIGRKKMALDHVLIESMDEEGDNSTDMESILKHGAAALFSEDKKKDAIVYDKAAVEKLLDRSATEETNREDGSTEGAFAFAKVWANDGTLAAEVDAVDHVVNVGVWDDILKQREEEARREALKNIEVLGRGGRRRQIASYAGPSYGFEEPHDNQDDQAKDESTEADEDFRGADGTESESSGEDGEYSQGLKDTGAEEPLAQQSSDNLPTALRAAPNGANRVATLDSNGPSAASPSLRRPSDLGNHQRVAHRHSPQLLQSTKRGHGNGLAKPPSDASARPQGSTPKPQRITDSLQQQHLVGSVHGRDPAPTSAAVDSDFSPLALTLLNGAVTVPNGMSNGTGHICFVCGFLHPINWACPEMCSVVRLRIALDNLREATNISEGQRRIRKEFLHTRLRDLTGIEKARPVDLPSRPMP
ncbi:hypothetical protein GQ53DRAFT_735069 [Thozetella sp. PMI_491]|nr:hypothetical protein GQ53DRAFT_735069 [Thozetella sp. PMI_491]